LSQTPPADFAHQMEEDKWKLYIGRPGFVLIFQDVQSCGHLK